MLELQFMIALVSMGAENCQGCIFLLFNYSKIIIIIFGETIADSAACLDFNTDDFVVLLSVLHIGCCSG